MGREGAKHDGVQNRAPSLAIESHNRKKKKKKERKLAIMCVSRPPSSQKKQQKKREMHTVVAAAIFVSVWLSLFLTCTDYLYMYIMYTCLLSALSNPTTCPPTKRRRRSKCPRERESTRELGLPHLAHRKE